MAQFDVYTYITSVESDVVYLLDIQNELLNDLSTRVVIPLMRNSKEIKHLHPKIMINDEEFILVTSQLSGVTLDVLDEKICNLSSKRDEIISAVDFMITGF